MCWSLTNRFPFGTPPLGGCHTSGRYRRDGRQLLDSLNFPKSVNTDQGKKGPIRKLNVGMPLYFISASFFTYHTNNLGVLNL